MVIVAREERRLTAILLMLLAFLLFTGIDTTAKWLVQAGLPATEVVFVRFAVHFMIAMALILPQEGRRLFRTSAPGQELLRGLFLVGSTFFNFFALKHLPLTVWAWGDHSMRLGHSRWPDRDFGAGNTHSRLSPLHRSRQSWPK